MSHCVALFITIDQSCLSHSPQHWYGTFGLEMPDVYLGRMVPPGSCLVELKNATTEKKVI